MREFKSGTIVKHFKREMLTDEEKATNMFLYEVLDNAKHCNTEEEFVVYRALYGDYQLWVRPKIEFYSRVDIEKYPSVKQEYRFEEFSRTEG